ncbi:MAG: hypothetical protein NC082_08440 [Clostridiales bacterium]|nr:hypothetical protein [Clostridiales bacterium]
MKFKIAIIIIICSISVTCCGIKNGKSDLERALEYAGENRAQLEKVLQHYKDDSLRLRAASFLISNMPGHYSYVDTTLINSYVFLD